MPTTRRRPSIWERRWFEGFDRSTMIFSFFLILIYSMADGGVGVVAILAAVVVIAATFGCGGGGSYLLRTWTPRCGGSSGDFMGVDLESRFEILGWFECLTSLFVRRSPRWCYCYYWCCSGGNVDGGRRRWWLLVVIRCFGVVGWDVGAVGVIVVVIESYGIVLDRY